MILWELRASYSLTKLNFEIRNKFFHIPNLDLLVLCSESYVFRILIQTDSLLNIWNVAIIKLPIFLIIILFELCFKFNHRVFYFIYHINCLINPSTSFSFLCKILDCSKFFNFLIRELIPSLLISCFIDNFLYVTNINL